MRCIFLSVLLKYVTYAEFTLRIKTKCVEETPYISNSFRLVKIVYSCMYCDLLFDEVHVLSKKPKRWVETGSTLLFNKGVSVHYAENFANATHVHETGMLCFSLVVELHQVRSLFERIIYCVC